MSWFEELLQVDVHNKAPTFLHVGLRTTYRVVRTLSGPEAVVRIREGRVEQQLQDTQKGLLDEPVEDRRDAELTLAPAGLGDRHPSHRLRLIAPREQFLAQAQPVHTQIAGQFLDGHPVDAATSRVLSNAGAAGALACRRLKRS